MQRSLKCGLRRCSNQYPAEPSRRHILSPHSGLLNQKKTLGGGAQQSLFKKPSGDSDTQPNWRAAAVGPLVLLLLPVLLGNTDLLLVKKLPDWWPLKALTCKRWLSPAGEAKSEWQGTWRKALPHFQPLPQPKFQAQGLSQNRYLWGFILNCLYLQRQKQQEQRGFVNDANLSSDYFCL